ncbi:uncharacterized protein NEMAJ01_0097 [Nematocida major]|uniref:uncharacterized protein n=1 Tax=Nematocida major TaxID=1912982 RepID=UPI002007D8D1|nr:uncharacterized protein NEMAJ01_0097 [Nematocida major]KAH9385201.1 hypothetical protein NEMAJ01_0097 [Nematocida major]
MNIHKTIQWSKTKIFFTVFAFIFCICAVFLSLLPAFEGTMSLSNVFTLLIGALHATKMIEFIFIATGGQWFTWLIGVYLLNLVGLIAFNYDDFMQALKELSSAPAES